jgi:hypothetical protein
VGDALSGITTFVVLVVVQSAVVRGGELPTSDGTTIAQFLSKVGDASLVGGTAYTLVGRYPDLVKLRLIVIHSTHTSDHPHRNGRSIFLRNFYDVCTCRAFIRGTNGGSTSAYSKNAYMYVVM